MSHCIAYASPLMYNASECDGGQVELAYGSIPKMTLFRGVDVMRLTDTTMRGGRRDHFSGLRHPSILLDMCNGQHKP